MASTRVGTIDEYLEELWERKGTDLHLSVGAPVSLRVGGDIERLGSHALTAAETKTLVHSLLSVAQRKDLDARRELDFSFSWRDQARIRGNAFFQQGNLSMALRLIPSAIPSMEDLGLPAVIERLVNAPQGFVLVTGPTGAGKSTTLASMIDYLNQRRACHIITIEDPLEYIHEHKVALVNQREVGVDTDSFERALRSVLREDPDVLLVGEMRDLESIQIALTIAETGHLVFATLHTNDTAQALDRIVDVFPGDRQTQIRVQLANALTGIVYQRLLPREGGGIVASFEILFATSAVRNLIHEGKTNQIRNVISTSQKDGMQTMEANLSQLVADGAITYDTALAYAVYPKEVVEPAPPEPEPEPVEGRRGRRGR